MIRPLPTGSALERADACPASCALPQVRSTSVYAEAGTQRHKYLELIQGGATKEEALAQIPEEHRPLCAAIDVEALPAGCAAEVAFALDVDTGAARELGRGINRDYSQVRPNEIALTVDLVGLSGEAVYIGDYKGPWATVTPAARNHQVRAGALAACRAYGRDHALVEIIRLREDGTPWRDIAELDTFDLDAFAYDLQVLRDRVLAARAVVEAGGVPDVAEGDHCRYCPAWHACPAKSSALVRVATGADLEPLATLPALSPELAGVAWERVRAAESLVKRLKAMARAAIAEAGPAGVPLSNGKRLREVITEGNLKLDGRIAYQVIRELHGQDLAEDAIDIDASQAAMKRALARAQQAGTIPARGATAALKAILTTIEERGGATRPRTRKLEEVAPELPAAEEAA